MVDTILAAIVGQKKGSYCPMEINTRPATSALLATKRIYRYCRFDVDRLRDFLKTGKLRFSLPACFNDPWDCRPLFDAPAEDRIFRAAICNLAIDWLATDGNSYTEEKRRQFALMMADDPEKYEVGARCVSAYFQQNLWDRYRLLCLTGRNNVPLMWSHYASSHQGVCLVFDTNDPVIGNARRVDYCSTYPTVPEHIDKEEFPRYSFLFKASYWSYEDEYRVIAANAPPGPTHGASSDARGYVEVAPTALTGIIRGSRMPIAERDVVEELVSGATHPIELHQANINHRDYGLTIERLK